MYKRKRQVPDPVGGQDFLPISLIKISNYSTPEGIFPNQESFLKSSLAVDSSLIVEYCTETSEHESMLRFSESKIASTTTREEQV